jgi:hypothetical protein
MGSGSRLARMAVLVLTPLRSSSSESPLRRFRRYGVGE